MSQSTINHAVIRGISSCVPQNRIDNMALEGFSKQELRKVVSMAGVNARYVCDENTCASDLCAEAAANLLQQLDWDPKSVDALIMVTQSPDYFLPSTACLVHRTLKLSDSCASFDVGLGCSGYPYGLYLANTMLNSGGIKRILLLHGETPSLFTHEEDRATVLLFGDAGSATAIEYQEDAVESHYVLHTDGAGYQDLIVPGGGYRNRYPENHLDNYVAMNGSNVFNFTIQRVPQLISDSLELANLEATDIDYYIFHQSNRFIMKHLMKRCGLEEDKVPLTLGEFGNTGGPSVPLTLCQGLSLPLDASKKMMLLGYGVGLSWGSAIVNIDRETVITHSIYQAGNG